MLRCGASKLAYMAKTKETMGERIRRCRKALKLTQEQLGEAAGVSGAAVAQWENGDTKSLRPENLFKIARALKKSAEWLATGDGTELPREQLYEALSELPDDNPQQALDFIQYRIDRAEGLMAADKMAHYHAMIEDFKRDLDERRKRDTRR